MSFLYISSIFQRRLLSHASQYGHLHGARSAKIIDSNGREALLIRLNCAPTNINFAQTYPSGAMKKA